MQFKDFVDPHIASLPQRRPLIFQHRPCPLTVARGKLFDVIRTQAYRLRVKNVPTSYYQGQDYVEDKRTSQAVMRAIVDFPAFIDSFSFYHNGVLVSVIQMKGFLLIELRRSLPISLWDDIRIFARGEQFIIGFFYFCLHKVNRTILDNKYLKGHLLARTFSIFELQRVEVECRGRKLGLAWPTAFLPYEPSAQLAAGINDIYMRDFMDAFGAYFRNDYDECIRKIITSAENFISERCWRPKPETLWACVKRTVRWRKMPSSRSFRRSISDNVRLTLISGEVINANMQEIYSVRNRIVHDGFHMSTNSSMFCSKSLGTLYYLIYRYSGNPIKSQFAYTLHMQFNLQCGATGERFDLYAIERAQKTRRSKVLPIVDSQDTMEVAVFNSMRFAPKDRMAIKS